MWRTVQETGSAVLLISQDLGVIANYCDRVAVLHDGRIVEDQPVRDFFAAPRHPYSREVLRLQIDASSASAAPVQTAEPLVDVRGRRRGCVDLKTQHFA